MDALLSLRHRRSMTPMVKGAGKAPYPAKVITAGFSRIPADTLGLGRPGAI